MKKCILAAFVFAIAAEARAYSQQQNEFLEQVAEAYAISDVCHSLGFQTESLALALRWNRIDSDEAMEEIKNRAAKDPWGIKQKRPDMVCLLGEMLYGRSGTKRQGLLHPKP